ncbi:Uncharacterised protein [Legionella cincinnatiensis]|uniref:Uncharacterized protein n=1 Tax=Legionella cincinnatiensis TaxID=28085 RepID=A0A378ILR6_9GAMM|nr:hypothetical protein Lcin_2529 [Legionella cincinnatiensis]STX35712.1 Uncharacterised protein [Legionella cincinnatiensis]
MHQKLNRNEYNAIAKEVTLQLRTLFPQAEPHVIHSVFGPEILAQPLRISTLKTKVDFEEIEKKALAQLREDIKLEKDKTIRKQKLQQLESIILFGQLLFSQSACLYFFRDCKSASISPQITKKLIDMNKLIEQEGLAIESSRFEVLSRRKKFDELFSEIHQRLKSMVNTASNKQIDVYRLQESLAKTKIFYYQINDLNFKYAQKPSRSFSTFVNTLQNCGSKVAITATVIAIGATALSFIPPLAPIMTPIALVASYVSLVVSVPLALKNLGTILYNLFRFGAAPSAGELIGVAFIATNLLTTGLSKLANQLVTLGVTGKWAIKTVNCLKEAENLTKASLGIVGQIGQSKQDVEIEQVNEHRLLLN